MNPTPTPDRFDTVLLYSEDNVWHTSINNTNIIGSYPNTPRTVKFTSETVSILLATFLNYYLLDTPLPYYEDYIIPWDSTSDMLEDIKHLIDDVFLTEPLSSSGCTTFHRYLLHVNANPILGYIPHIQEPHLYTDPIMYACMKSGKLFPNLTASIKKDRDNKISDARAQAYAMESIIIENQLSVAYDFQRRFPSICSFLLWLIYMSASENKRIKICSVCNHYFSPKSNKGQYCSNSCKNIFDSTHSFGGVSEIKKIYHSIDKLLRQKYQASQKNCCPYYIPAEHSIPTNTYEIEEITNTYNTEFKQRLSQFNSALYQKRQNPTPENELHFNQESSAFLAWLTEQHNFVKSLRLHK